MIKIPLETKKKLFPEVDDFTKDFNKYKNQKVLGNLGPREWFYYHPSAVKLMNASIPTVGILLYGSLFVYNIFLKNTKWAIILAIVTVFFIYIGIKTYPNLKYVDTTFYDIILKEESVYELEEVKSQWQTSEVKKE